MVTSPGPAEGKTTTAANLAAILAETGRSVLVVNCDFRRPRIHAFLGGTEQTRTVSDTRIDNVKLVTHVLDNPNLANPADVVRVQRDVIRNARTMFDIVLLDTAPLLTTNDATEVLEVADQVVIVSKAGKTHKEAADRAAELLERRHGPVVGVVLVGATDIPTSRYYYYGDVRHEVDADRDERAPFDALATPAPAAPPPPVADRTTDGGADPTAGPHPDLTAAHLGAADLPTAPTTDPAPADAPDGSAASDVPVASTTGPTGPNGSNGDTHGNGHGNRDRRGAVPDLGTASPGTDPAAGSLRGR